MAAVTGNKVCALVFCKNRKHHSKTNISVSCLQNGSNFQETVSFSTNCE